MNRTPIKDSASSTRQIADAGQSSRSIALIDNRIESRQLFENAREITIAHGDEIYRLRVTSQNKLILTK
jgi:hemin uptake protein HemP